MYKVLSLLAVLSLAAASDVLEYTDDDFEDKIGDHDIILVEFFAPWCGHCKRLAPEYEKAATALKNNDPPVSLAKVDCTAHTKTCGKYGVSGYPTLKIFKGGSLSDDYNGPREADGIVKYMRSKAGPASKDLKSLEDAEKFIGGDEHVVVGFFSSEGSDLQKQFQKVADSLSEDFKFGHSTNSEVLDKYNYKDTVVLFQPKRLHNKFESSEQKYDGDAAQSKIKKWVSDNVHGLAGHRTSGNSEQFKKPLVVAYYNVDYVKDPKGTNYWRNRVMKVGKKLKEAGKEVYFAVSNSDDFSYELSEYGLSASGDKPVVAAKDSKDQKFIMTDEFSMDALEKFVTGFLAGDLEPYLKSEPVPEPNDGPVKVVVAKNFNEIVNDDSKDVLIEFYAPWCGHCKNLAPKYDELGEKLADEESITIAKMDATANDVPKEYQVQGFPTIYFSPKGSKSNPKRYEGGREVKDFIKYIAKESTDELSGWDRDGKKKKSKKSKEEL